MSIEVHRTLGGPGLLESIYEAALCHELILRGLRVHRQRPVQVVYKGVAIREPLFIDIVVEDKVLVEIKVDREISDQLLFAFEMVCNFAQSCLR